MLYSHPCDTCYVWSNFKETYLELVSALVLGLVGTWANKPHMFIFNILYTQYRENIMFREYIKDNQQRVTFHVMLC